MKYILLIVTTLMTFGMQAGTPAKESSVLATGQWVRIAVVETGIHAISYNQLVAMGLDPGQYPPASFRLFGNGGGMLPESNASPRIDDLRENAIEILGGADGSFDPGDLLLFYGEGPDKWVLDTQTKLYRNLKNLYSDSTYYFLTAGGDAGNRVVTRPSSTEPPTSYSYRFDDYAIHEKDSLNLIRSGKIWFGEVFNNEKTTRTFSFLLPDVDSLSVMTLRTYVAARASNVSYFRIFVNGEKVDSVKVDATPSNSYSDYGKAKLKSTLLLRPQSFTEITLDYSLPLANSLGWLNYLEINAVRFLKFTGPQMPFRDLNTMTPGKVNEFVMSSPVQDIRIWDVTDPGQIMDQEFSFTGNTLKFRIVTDTLREFIAFDGTSYLPVYYSAAIPNQNLHALQPATLVIVTHPRFLSQAEKLAAFHLESNGISSLVVPTDQIYNEFACGQKDITAIRDFVKMIYDRGGSGSDRLRYLLLFGDGSYDPKDRVPGNNNLVPTFQSAESLKFVLSYVTDDYFGILEATEGADCSGDLEIGIGRFPVTTSADADIMVNKILTYAARNDTVMADWRNLITMIADDENDNLHLQKTEELMAIVDSKYPQLNTNKIYLDAYKMEKIPAGLRFPDVNIAINEAMAKGTIIMNYTGHGSEAGWSYEQVMTVSDIESWTNNPVLPVMITATCEFSRFDNPERYTAGEMVLIHPRGGVISLYSTTRLALATSNFRLDSSFFLHLRDKIDGEYVKMGDLIRISKNNNSNDVKLRNFVLFGDPAQEIAFPHRTVRTISINQEAVNQPDTVLGLSTVEVTGQIEDESGQKLSNFNGILSVKVYDKPYTYKTLGNTDDSYPQTFRSQNVLLYRGSHTVTQGEFDFTFVVPRDIAQQFGRGKISYYATDLESDAEGYTDQLIIGGQDPNIQPVNSGPDIALYLDSRSFVPGSATGPNPLFLADLHDTNGINYIGLGIGHDIVAVLDGNETEPILLNDYYMQEMNNQSAGTISYPLQGLSTGIHTLSLKAWDLYGNSSIREISFYVADQSGLVVENVENRPNPVNSHTYFMFQPQQNTGGLDVTVRIFDAAGRPVRTLTAFFPETDGYPMSLYWDGTGENGQRPGNGVYPYQVQFKGRDGTVSHTARKLVIMH